MFHENFALDSKKGKAQAYMYEQLWEILEIHMKKMETEHKNKVRKQKNKKDLQNIKRTL